MALANELYDLVLAITIEVYDPFVVFYLIHIAYVMDIVVGRRDTMIILHNGFMDLDTHIRYIFKFQQAQCYKKGKMLT